MASAHINFNFQARLNKASAKQFSELQKQAKAILPAMNPTPINEFHVTFGASSYFSSTGERIKVDLQSDAITNDYQRILSGLKSYSFNPITNLKITGFRVTDNGFIVVDLKGNQAANNIATCYRNAHFHDAMKLKLTKYYRTSKDFSIHVTLGKIDAPKNSLHKEQYTQSINTNIYNSSASTLAIKKKGILSVSYNAHKTRHIIKSNIIPFRLPTPKSASVDSGSFEPMINSGSSHSPIKTQSFLNKIFGSRHKTYLGVSTAVLGNVLLYIYFPNLFLASFLILVTCNLGILAYNKWKTSLKANAIETVNKNQQEDCPLDDFNIDRCTNKYNNLSFLGSLKKQQKSADNKDTKVNAGFDKKRKHKSKRISIYPRTYSQ